MAEMQEQADGGPDAEAEAELSEAAVQSYFDSEGEDGSGGEGGSGAPLQAPAPEPAERQGAGDRRPPAGHVPLAALQEERERRRELQSRLQALEQRLKAPEAQPAAQPTAEPDPQPAPDPEPDRAADLPAWLEWRDRQAEKRLTAVENVARAQAEAVQQAQALQQVRAHVQQQEQTFRAAHPDYDAAYDHAIAQERRRLAEIEGIADPAQQDRVLAQIERQFVLGALRQGRNPAEAVYRYARWAGYRSQDGAAGPGSGTAPDPAAPEPAAHEPTASGQRPAPPRSLGAARSAPSGGALTPEALAEMPEAEFRRLTASAAGRDRVNALLGEGFIAEY